MNNRSIIGKMDMLFYLKQSLAGIPRAMIGVAVLLFSAHAAQAGDFAPLRYDDDFSGVSDENDLYARLKHTDIGSAKRYLSVGGDLRERIEYYSRPSVSTKTANDDTFLLHRLLLHVDTHWDDARVFVQLGNHEESGRELGPKPTDVDQIDVQQAFVDYSITLDGESRLFVRGGRQELMFGAARLISVRDGPNIHIDFDGARAQWQNKAWSVTALAVRPVNIAPGQFDDKATHDQSLWGAYATTRFRARENISGDFYYFDSSNNHATYNSIAGDENRNTFGARLYGRSEGFDGDIELILQNGTITGDSIHAFALSTDSGWTWQKYKWHPRLGLRTDVISGDQNAKDGTLGTFNALYPNGSYFSETSIVAPANLIDFSASLMLKPTSAIDVTWSINPLWRYSTDDAMYRLPLAPLIAGDSSTARYIGTQQQLLGIWRYNNFVSFKAALVKFDAGEFVHRGGGHNLDYAQLSSSVRF